MPPTLLMILKWILGLAMIGVGVLHFTSPKGFEAIVPKSLPAPRMLVYVSGVAEIAGGIGVLIPFTQVWAAWGLIALYVAVFPANINMAINDLPLGKTKVPRWAQWARLPFQALFIAWAWLFTS
ncbi:MAG: DoxX family protein [Archangium sp.]|nr:DoxX family protein [Archangium sp.]